MTQISFLQKLTRVEPEELDDVIEKLKEIAKIVLNKETLRLSIVSESKSVAAVKKHLGDFVGSLPGVPRKIPDLMDFSAGGFVPSDVQPKTFFVLPSSVNYVAKCLSAVPFTHEDSAPLQILLKILSNCYLHTEIREKGGAYGSGASLQSGIMGFSSYRDPNITKTLSVIDDSVNWVKKNTFTEEDIVEAKISVFSDIDAPVPPSGKGLAEFYRGLTLELRQKRRERLLTTERKDLQRVAELYLPPVKDKGVVAVLGGQEMVEEMKQLNWHVKSE